MKTDRMEEGEGGGRDRNVMEGAETEMKESRPTRQETEGMKCALAVFRFQPFGTSLFPSQSLCSQTPKHLRHSELSRDGWTVTAVCSFPVLSS